jgi:hypothetical protein
MVKLPDHHGNIQKGDLICTKLGKKGVWHLITFYLYCTYGREGTHKQAG